MATTRKKTSFHRFTPAERSAAALLMAAETQSGGEWAPTGTTIEETIAAGLRHGLAGLLFDACGRCSVDVPQALRRKLQDTAQHITTTNLNGNAALAPIAAALRNAGLPFLVLKGAHLNRAAYSELHHRPMTDIDLLLHPEDAGRADRVLVQAGCTPGKPLVREDFYPRFYYEKEYHSPAPLCFRLDVHVRPFRPLRYAATVPEAALWDNAGEIDVAGIPVAVPSPANTLIHLAVHSTVHGNARLIWLYDIHRVANKFAAEIDADEICRRLEAWKLNHAARLALALTAELFDNAALRSLADRINPKSTWAERLICRQAPRDEQHRIAAVLTNFITTPDRRLRWGYLKAVLSPEQSQLAELYPYRHPGWQLAAHARRIARTITRPLARR